MIASALHELLCMIRLPYLKIGTDLNGHTPKAWEAITSVNTLWLRHARARVKDGCGTSWRRENFFTSQPTYSHFVTKPQGRVVRVPNHCGIKAHGWPQGSGQENRRWQPCQGSSVSDRPISLSTFQPSQIAHQPTRPPSPRSHPISGLSSSYPDGSKPDFSSTIVEMFMQPARLLLHETLIMELH